GTALFTDAGYWWRSDGTPDGTVRVVQFTDTPTELQSLGSAAAAVGRTVYVGGSDPEQGRELWGIALPAATGSASVVARHVYYGGSPTQPTATGAPVAADARPLLPGQVSSSANYTSYARGINGILVDITGL